MKSSDEIKAMVADRTVEVGDCVEWQGKMGRGSAKFPNTPIIATRRDGKAVNLVVARLVYESVHGAIPAGKLVYRACCNNLCVAAAHLKAGTLADVKRARRAAGLTAHSPAVIAALTKGARSRVNVVNTMEKARAVRTLVAEGLPDDAIAARTGVGRAMVSDIRRGRAWQEQCHGASVFNLGARP